MTQIQKLMNEHEADVEKYEQLQQIIRDRLAKISPSHEARQKSVSFILGILDTHSEEDGGMEDLIFSEVAKCDAVPSTYDEIVSREALCYFEKLEVDLKNTIEELQRILAESLKEKSHLIGL